MEEYINYLSIAGTNLKTLPRAITRLTITACHCMLVSILNCNYKMKKNSMSVSAVHTWRFYNKQL